MPHVAGGGRRRSPIGGWPGSVGWWSVARSAAGPRSPARPVARSPASARRGPTPQMERANLAVALRKAGGRVAGSTGAAALRGMNANTRASRLRAFGFRRTYPEDTARPSVARLGSVTVEPARVPSARRPWRYLQLHTIHGPRLLGASPRRHAAPGPCASALHRTRRGRGHASADR